MRFGYLRFMFLFCVAIVLWKLLPIVIVVWWVCAHPWLAGLVFGGGMIWGLFIVPAASRARSGAAVMQPATADGMNEMAAYHNQRPSKLRSDYYGIPVYCTVCGQRKQPVGRSAPIGMAMCDNDCPGYDQKPLPSHLWPGESEAEFGYQVPR